MKEKEKSHYKDKEEDKKKWVERPKGEREDEVMSEKNWE